MALADARAIYPALDARPADPQADAALLDQIAAWCERYTPIVVIDAPHRLFLDISGCAHLLGGEAALLKDVKSRLKRQRLCLRAAIAPTPGAAWALTHAGERESVDENHLAEALAHLPVEALRLDTSAAALLKRLGLKRIGQLCDAPRAAFAARAGQNAMLRLDQAFGRAGEALTPRRPPPPLYQLRKLAEPIVTLDALMLVTQDLCESLCQILDEKGFGAQYLRITAFGVDMRLHQIELRLSHSERCPKMMVRLFREKLEREAERFNAEFGFEAVRLDALETSPWILRAVDLAPREAIYDVESEARLIDRIAARLGHARIGKIGVRDVHAPERASAALTNASLDAPAPQDGVMRRPLTLFARAHPIDAMASVPDGPPLRFRWRRVQHIIVRAEGPERIAPHWLRASDAKTRDYYRVEDAEGRRFWLYREGFYDGAEPPRWFLHGLFA